MATRNIRGQVGREYVLELLGNMYEPPSVARSRAYDAAEDAWMLLVRDGELPTPKQLRSCVSVWASCEKHKHAVKAYTDEAFS